MVIAIIAILAGMLLPVLAKSKDKAHQTMCRSNLRQLTLAMQLYTDSNYDRFPGAASKGSYAPMKEDWIFWNTYDTRLGGTIFRDPQQSALAPYIARFNTNLFRCPADREAVKRQQLLEKNPRGGINYYIYSYTLNSYVESSQNRGISSIYDSTGSAPPLHFKSTAIKNPANKIMFVEEHSQVTAGATADPDDGRWVPPGNNISERHSKKGTVSLCDGHVEAVRRSYGAERLHYDPMY